MCLSIWNRSPAAYQELKESGMLRLPSGRLLQLYKNSVPQTPGFNKEVLQWMKLEAEKLKLDDFGKSGGIILDEMAIQVKCALSSRFYFSQLRWVDNLQQSCANPSHDEISALYS